MVPPTSWSPSPQYRKVVEANRQFYARNAHAYDTTETCLTDPEAQAYLEEALDTIVAQAGKPPHHLRALDACGGTGNIALKLLHRGVRTAVIDVSQDQLDILQSKCREAGFTADVSCSEIGEFLAKSPEEFDLIVFSSALHHLEDVLGVLKLSSEALKPGGLLFTIHDPTPAEEMTRLTRVILRLDYFSFVCLENLSDLPAAIGRRVWRMMQGAKASRREDMEISTATVGVLAEYHVNFGLDDREIVRQLETMGLRVIWHKRRAGGRYGLTRRIVQLLGDVTQFELLLRRGG